MIGAGLSVAATEIIQHGQLNTARSVECMIWYDLILLRMYRTGGMGEDRVGEDVRIRRIKEISDQERGRRGNAQKIYGR
jgi:hypothetical protein